MIRRLLSLLLFWTPTVVVLSTLACTTRITRHILSTTVSNVLFLLDLLYLSLVASIALVIHTRFIPLQIAQPHSARIDSTGALPSSSSTNPSALLLPSSPPPPPSKEKSQPKPSIQNEGPPSLSRIPRRSKSLSSSSASIVPRRPPPPPPSPSHHNHNHNCQPIPILATSATQHQPQQHRVRFTSLPSSIAQDPRSRVVSPLASQLQKTQEAFFPSTTTNSSIGNGGVEDEGRRVGEEVERERVRGGKGKEREEKRADEMKPMTPPSSPEIELLGDLRDEEDDGMAGVVGGSGARRRRAAAVQSTRREDDAVGGSAGLSLVESGEDRESIVP